MLQQLQTRNTLREEGQTPRKDTTQTPNSARKPYNVVGNYGPQTLNFVKEGRKDKKKDLPPTLSSARGWLNLATTDGRSSNLNWSRTLRRTSSREMITTRGPKHYTFRRLNIDGACFLEFVSETRIAFATRSYGSHMSLFSTTRKKAILVPLATAKSLVAQSFGGAARMSLKNMTALNVSERIEKRLRLYISRQISNRCLIEVR